ncbi:MAG: sugar phosphate isomerase/epimerase, partial [Planctomycetaceae bacterium]|nr:sugar phosphate isomerase/epimerase [Planctomycetaceae bacterium]
TRAAGYAGVELFQDCTQGAFGTPQQILDQFNAESMHLIGISCGSLQERINFVTQYAACMKLAPSDYGVPYVYLDDWNESICRAALEKGIRLALHPHMYRPVQTLQEAKKRLQQYDFMHYKSMEFMPDTAHLTIAGDDPEAAVYDHFLRIRAIHVKDWNSNVGRSYQFYASGFCPLGTGGVKVKETLDVLWKRSFSGWLVIEHDTSPQPDKDISLSMQWLRENLPPTLFET